MNFKSKYLRRYERLIDILKNEKEIIFVYKGNCRDMRYYSRFYDAVIKYRGDKKFWFVNIIDGQIYNHPVPLDNFISFDIVSYLLGKEKDDWQSSHINWQVIFTKILLRIRP